MKKWNEWMRASNGNGKMTILHQNIPCTYRSKVAEALIMDIISRYKPLCLFLGEIDKEVLETCLVPGYNLITGKVKGHNKTRMNCYVQDTATIKILDMDCEIPTVAFETLGWKMIGAYREWRLPGTNGTAKIGRHVGMGQPRLG